MNENMKVTDSRGIPTLKALWLGIIIDGSDPPNRHLELAGFEGKELFLELVEVSYDPADEDLGEEGEEDLGGGPIPYMPEEPSEEVAEECTRYPDGCVSCGDGECNGPDAEIPDEDETYVELSLAYRKKLDPEAETQGRWAELADEEIAANAPLCRFLNLINDAHGL